MTTMTTDLTDLTEIRRRRQATATLRSALGVPELSSEWVLTYRPHAAALTDRIVTRVCREVAAFAAFPTPAVRQVVTQAVRAAVDLFVDVLADRPSEARRVFDLFRDLGQMQQAGGTGLDALRAAHHVATQEAWDEIRHHAGDLPGDVTTRLVGALFVFQRQLLDQATFGWLATRGGTAQRLDARDRLVTALLSGDSDLATLAADAGWDVPSEVVVAAHRPGPDLAVDRALVLTTHRDDVVLIVGRPEDVESAIASAGVATGPVALSWPVAVTDAKHAVRWSSRLLDLVEDGTVLAGPDDVVRCCDHQRLLWLAADPALARRACEDLLRPLLETSGRHRVVLAQTLRLWLQTRGSAVALADALDVHAQTVRTRLKQLRQLFGTQLDDPETVSSLLVALESAAPRWNRDSRAS